MKHKLEFEVRDNETDLQGIVNNANYFVYMAHARHKYLKELGIDFNALHEAGFDLVLVHSDMNFKASLKSGDEFIVSSEIKPNGRIRLDIIQEIIRQSDNKVVANAVNTAVCIDNKSGRPCMPDLISNIVSKFNDQRVQKP